MPPSPPYWPEFAAAGKEAIPVRWLLSHQAGLVAVDRTFDRRRDLRVGPDHPRALAAQAPMWEPGKQHAYHALTYGHLVGEVLRRISGKTVGQLFADEVAGPARPVDLDRPARVGGAARGPPGAGAAGRAGGAAAAPRHGARTRAPCSSGPSSVPPPSW